MLVDTHRLPKTAPRPIRPVQWVELMDLWNAQPEEYRKTITVGMPFRETAVDVIERIEAKTSFWYQRDITGPGRATSIDLYGIVGLSTLDLSQKECFITEGVSDFMSLKMCYPYLNVLGFTTLGGKPDALKIIASLFNRVAYVADSDVIGTGLSAALRVKNQLEVLGVRTQIVQPEPPYKDITQQILNTKS